MKRKYLNKRAVPTLVLFALSVAVFAACNSSERNYSKAFDASGSRKMSAGKGQSGPLGGEVRMIVPGTDAQNDNPSVSEVAPLSLKERFLSEFKQYKEDQKKKDGSNALALINKLIAKSSMNVRVTSNLAKKEGDEYYSVGEETVFVEGDYVSYVVSCELQENETAYVYLFYQDANGNVKLLYPNDLKNKDGVVGKTLEDLNGEVNKIEMGETKTLPAKGDWLKATSPYGTEYLLAIVTNEKIKNEALRELVGENSLRSISAEHIATFAKGLDPGTDVGAEPHSIIDPPSPGDKPNSTFKYGVSRLQTCVFENEEKKQEYLANPKTYFVGIGIDDYLDDIPKLSGCKNDVKGLAKVLQEQNAVNEAETIFLLDKEADVEHIKYLFSVFLPSVVRPCDRLIVHWSSHGERMNENGYERMLFVPYDAEIISKVSMKLKVDSVISSDDLNRWNYLLPGRKTLYLIDCCYAGGAIDQGFNWVSATFTKSLGGTNMAIVASSSDDQVSLIDQKNPNHSLMSGILTDYIRKQRGVDAFGLGDKIKDDVEKISVEQRNMKQHVWSASGMPEGEFIINP